MVRPQSVQMNLPKVEQVKPWFYNLPPAGLAGVNPRGCAEKFIKAQY